MLRLRCAPLSMTVSYAERNLLKKRQLALVASCLMLLNCFDKIIEHELRVLRAAGGLRVELRGEERLGLVLDAFRCRR